VGSSEIDIWKRVYLHSGYFRERQAAESSVVMTGYMQSSLFQSDRCYWKI